MGASLPPPACSAILDADITPFVAAELCRQKEAVEAERARADSPSVHEERVGALEAAIRAAQQDVERLTKETR